MMIGRSFECRVEREYACEGQTYCFKKMRPIYDKKNRFILNWFKYLHGVGGLLITYVNTVIQTIKAMIPLIIIKVCKYSGNDFSSFLF